MRDIDPLEEYKIKLVLVGESGTGKTNIRERLCHNNFDPFSVKTIGVQYSSRKFYAPFEQRMRKFSVCIWDILGELNNPDLTASYFKNAMGVIYVFDLTNEESLSNLKYWHDKVDEQIGIKRLQILLGNKKDLTHLREVSASVAQHFQREMNMSQYSQVSALEPMGGVNQALYEFLTTIVNQFNFGLRKPIKLRKGEQHHRSCI